MRLPTTLSLLLLLGTACKESNPATDGEPPVATAPVPSASPTASPSNSAVALEVDEALTALGAQALPLTPDNHDRSHTCAHLKVIAAAVDHCAPCRATYAKVLAGEGDQHVVDCSAEQLVRVYEGAPPLCAALIASWKRNKYANSQALAGLSTLGAACKAQMDDFIAVLEERFGAFENTWGDLRPANLIYVDRMLEHMTPRQKTRIAAAAKMLQERAGEKKDHEGAVAERLVEEAKKLATDASS